jgi:hypothetical protein
MSRLGNALRWFCDSQRTDAEREGQKRRERARHPSAESDLDPKKLIARYDALLDRRRS